MKKTAMHPKEEARRTVTTSEARQVPCVKKHRSYHPQVPRQPRRGQRGINDIKISFSCISSPRYPAAIRTTAAGGHEKSESDSGEIDHISSDATALENYAPAPLNTTGEIANERFLSVVGFWRQVFLMDQSRGKHISKVVELARNLVSACRPSRATKKSCSRQRGNAF